LQGTFEELYREASKEFVFLNATDGQWPNAILLQMLPLTGEWDVIIASRKNKHYGLQRSLVSWGFNLMPRLLFRVQTYDAGAVKLVRREVFDGIPVVSRSAFAEAERLIRAARAGYRIMALPVETSPCQAGRSSTVRLSTVGNSLADVWRLWRSIH
jgi:hypothetical protein